MDLRLFNVFGGRSRRSRRRCQALLKPADAEIEGSLPRERGLSLARARFRRRARLEPPLDRSREGEGGGEDEADNKPGDGPQGQFAVEETTVALHLLGPAHAIAVEPFTVTLQLLLRGGNDAAREPERPVGTGNLRLDLVRQLRHDLGSHSSGGCAQGSRDANDEPTSASPMRSAFYGGLPDAQPLLHPCRNHSAKLLRKTEARMQGCALLKPWLQGRRLAGRADRPGFRSGIAAKPAEKL